ncbi:MAG: hypothetical protein GY930_11280, partial [bacterium]|nr:hypothetical protein [bacterium]
MNFNKSILPLFLITLASGLTFGLDPLNSPSKTASTEDPRTVTVTVWGESTADPSYFTMDASLAGNADLASEALENYNQSLTRVTGAFQESGLAAVKVKRKGLDFQYTPKAKGNNHNNVMFAGPQPESNDPGVTCREKLEIRFEPAGESKAQQEQVASALDLALELGLKVKTNVVDPYNRSMSSNGRGQAQGAIAATLADETRREAELAAQVDGLEEARVLATHLAQSSSATLGVVRRI